LFHAIAPYFTAAANPEVTMSSKGDKRHYFIPRGNQAARGWLIFSAILVIAGLGLAAQQLPDAPTPQNTPPPPAGSQPAVKPQDVPDAPSTNRADPPAPPAARTAPQPQVKTVPSGSAPASEGSRDELFRLTTNVNFVLVPVTVKDTSDHLVEGLLKNDFSIYEDGAPQQISFFTSDPFPLSAAVVFDLALPDITVRKVDQTLSALAGAFSQFDEIALFAYGSTVQKVQDFSALNDQVARSLQKLKRLRGRTGGPGAPGGPFSGPSINGRPVDPNVPQVQTVPKESSVLNDAILAAANELGRREPTRRKILFIISDGREVGSSASYGDVLKVLLSNQISVYAVGVGGAAIPGYRQLQKIRVPGLGYGDILPKYASATGGQVFNEINEQAIESAYGRVTEEARNQYTIGYTTRATPSSSFRSIEVRISRPGLRVYARDGYYQLPAR